MKLLVICVMVCMGLGCTAEIEKKPGPVEKAGIADTLNALIEENEIPGLNFSLVFPDGRQENHCSGFADLEQGIRLDQNHLMFSGSIGKTYVTALIMQFVESGKIDLQSRLLDYFPETDWLKRLPNAGEISVEMLLQHTSGLPRYEMKPGVWVLLNENPDKVWTYEERLAFIFEDQAVHPAGQGWSYSDSNYILLGMLIEKTSDRPYYEILQQNLLGPLRLQETFPALSRENERLPAGYSRLPESFMMPPKVVADGRYVFNPQLEWSGGGLLSSTADLARWGAAYYRGGLFPGELQEKIITPNSHGESIWPGVSYGTGSFIYETRHGKAYGHTGFVPGFNSIMAYFPQKGITLALQANCDYAAEKISLVGYLERILDCL